MKNVLIKLTLCFLATQLCACAHYLGPVDYGARQDDPRSADVLLCYNQAEQFQQLSGSLRSWPHNNTFDACMNKLGYHRVSSN